MASGRSRLLLPGGGRGQRGGVVARLAPSLAAHVEKLYGGGGGPSRCPGDGDPDAGVEPCARWLRAGGPGVSREEQETACKACDRCDGRAPLDEEAATPDAADEDQALILRVEGIVSERRSGRPIDLSDVTGLEWRLLTYWDACVDAQERAHKARVKGLYEVLLARLKVGI